MSFCRGGSRPDYKRSLCNPDYKEIAEMVESSEFSPVNKTLTPQGEKMYTDDIRFLKSMSLSTVMFTIPLCPIASKFSENRNDMKVLIYT